MSTATPAPRSVTGLDRRQLLTSGLAAGAGLVIGLYLPRRADALGAAGAAEPPGFNAFVRIGADDTVTIIAKHLEMGQGSHTGLATLLAEELDADWTQVRVVDAPADVERYKNLLFGMQGTGGSTAMANSFEQMRRAGASARAMLVAAAAEEWKAPAAEISVSEGVVRHAASGRSARFGELAVRAAALAPPAEVTLKSPGDFKLIGREDLPRVDLAGKSRGSSIFTADFALPGMRIALVAHPARFGATVKGFDAAEAKQVPGVVDVVAIPQGVAVLATGFWAAKKGRDALRVEWDESAAEKRGTSELLAEYRALLDRPGAVARHDGDAEAALASAAKVVAADFEFPYLAHAPMEPLDCVLRRTEQGCEVWAGSQIQTGDQAAVAGVLGLEPEQVSITTLLAGGSFGRRATPASEFVAEAAEILKATGGRYPVKLLWTREDDLRGGYYRPMFLHRVRAGLDAAGKVIAWSHRIVGQSIMTGTSFEAFSVKDGIDSSSVEGVSELPYAIPNVRVELHSPRVGVPVLWWRSVGHSQNAYAVEAFLDQVARAAGKDPLELRRELLAGHPRHLAALELAADKAGWGRPLSAGRARGLAVHESFGSVVAEVAEVSAGEGGAPRVERVVCAVDCGLAINPDTIRAQMEGGVGYGLAAALHGEIALDAGRVVQGNFTQYRPLRLGEMPAVEVHIVPSAAPPSGVGEPGLPPIAPAVANAWLALNGKPIQRLPFRNLTGEKS